MREEEKKMSLTANNVRSVFDDVLFKETELENGMPIVEMIAVNGIRSNFGFHKERLLGHKQELIDLIDQLPDLDEGVSFLNLCFTKDGNHWGEHMNMEQLIVMGIGAGILQKLVRREMWMIFPGGLPFIWKVPEKELTIELKKD